MVREGLLAGKTTVITAAGSGMGRASALTFAREGASVVVADIDEAKAHAVAEEVGAQSEPFVVDVADDGQLRALFAFAGERFGGKLDVLFHHAGMPGPRGLELELDEWQHCVDVNMRSGFYAARYAHPLLKAAGGGSIIFTSSVSGLVGSVNSPLYSMTKGGVVVFAKALALSLAPDKIRVNAICPGATDTPMLPEFFGAGIGEEQARELQASFATTIPLGRYARPEEIADAALYLASDLSTYVTGIALPVDGGVTAR